MARRWKAGSGKIVIWNGETDTLPFDDPLAYADRVLFSTTFNYSRIIDKRTVNCTFPAALTGGERSGTIPLFAHGRAGMPRVRANTVIGGIKISLGCHVPIQESPARNSAGRLLANTPRLVILGATTTDVVACWYCDLRGRGSGATAYDLPSITLPITVEVFAEMN